MTNSLGALVVISSFKGKIAWALVVLVMQLGGLHSNFPLH